MLFSSLQREDQAEGESNDVSHTADDRCKLDKPKSQRDSKRNKRFHFKNILFQKKKQKYQVSTEALATDDNKIKKRQKVSRGNSFGKSLRNMISCTSSVTTV